MLTAIRRYHSIVPVSRTPNVFATLIMPLCISHVFLVGLGAWALGKTMEKSRLRMEKSGLRMEHSWLRIDQALRSLSTKIDEHHEFWVNHYELHVSPLAYPLAPKLTPLQGIHPYHPYQAAPLVSSSKSPAVDPSVS